MKEASHGKLHWSLVRIVSGSLASSHFLPILRAQRRDRRVRLADVANGLAPRLLKTAFTIYFSLLRRRV
jgi:hypothetical protein